MRSRKHAQDGVLAVIGRNDGNAHVHVAEILYLHFEAAVLREKVLVRPQPRKHFDAAYDLRVKLDARLRFLKNVVEEAVNAVADAQVVLRRFKVDVRCPRAVGVGNKEVYEVDDGDLLERLTQFAFNERP